MENLVFLRICPQEPSETHWLLKRADFAHLFLWCVFNVFQMQCSETHHKSRWAKSAHFNNQCVSDNSWGQTIKNSRFSICFWWANWLDVKENVEFKGWHSPPKRRVENLRFSRAHTPEPSETHQLSKWADFAHPFLWCVFKHCNWKTLKTHHKSRCAKSAHFNN